MIKGRKNDKKDVSFNFEEKFNNLLYTKMDTPMITTRTTAAAVIIPMVVSSSKCNCFSPWRKQSNISSL